MLKDVSGGFKGFLRVLGAFQGGLRDVSGSLMGFHGHSTQFYVYFKGS